MPSIESVLAGYGWELHIAAAVDTVTPCPWGEGEFGIKSIIPVNKISEIKVDDFAAVIIMPGRTHVNLINSPDMIRLVREAHQKIR